MNDLACNALKLVRVLAMKAARGPLSPYEEDLYKASSQFATSILRFEDACAQSAMIREERNLDALRSSA